MTPNEMSDAALKDGLAILRELLERDSSDVQVFEDDSNDDLHCLDLAINGEPFRLYLTEA